MKLRPWAMMPTEWIKQGRLLNFRWKDDGSAGIAALMIYFTLCQFAAPRTLRPSELEEPPLDVNVPPDSAPSAALLVDSTPSPRPLLVASQEDDAWSSLVSGLPSSPPWANAPAETTPDRGANSGLIILREADDIKVLATPNRNILQISSGTNSQSSTPPAARIEDSVEEDYRAADILVARATYEDLIAMTGLSRDRINVGLQKLKEQKMIWRIDRSSTYGLCGFGPGKRWAKLPGKILLSTGGTTILPFTHFKKRSKDELHALKLHFYYASTRANNAAYSEVAYQMIHQRTGVQQRDIPRANSFLVSCGILQRTRGMPNDDPLNHEANKYYLTGYNDFFLKKKIA